MNREDPNAGAHAGERGAPPPAGSAGVPRAAGDDDIVAMLRRAAADLPAPPPDVRAALRAIFTRGSVDELEARLAGDSRWPRELVGVRAGDTSPAFEGWSLTYDSQAGEIVVDVWPLDGDEVACDVQMFCEGEGDAWHLALRGPLDRAVRTDGYGHASFGTIPVGRYRLVARKGEIAIGADVAIEPEARGDDER